MRRKNTKKIATVVMVTALTLGMSVTAMASPQGQQEPKGGEMRQEMNGERPEQAPETDGKQQDAGQMMPAGEQSNTNAPEPKELPEGEEAVAPEDLPEMPENAEEGLKPGEKPENMDGQMKDDGRGISTEAITELIDSVEDEDTKASLTELLEAYQTAMDAQKEALDEAEEGADLSEYDEAVKSAWDALKEAMDEAGLEYEEELVPEDNGEFAPDGEIREPKEGEENEKLDADSDNDSEDTDAVNVTVTEKKQPVKQFFAKIGSWFKKLFNRG